MGYSSITIIDQFLQDVNKYIHEHSSQNNNNIQPEILFKPIETLKKRNILIHICITLSHTKYTF